MACAFRWVAAPLIALTVCSVAPVLVHEAYACAALVLAAAENERMDPLHIDQVRDVEPAPQSWFTPAVTGAGVSVGGETPLALASYADPKGITFRLQ
jgi:hypothetical protein